MSDFEKWHEQLNGDEKEALEAIQHFEANPDERAVDRLMEIALSPNRNEDEQYEAGWVVFDTVGAQRFAEIIGDVCRNSTGSRRLKALKILSYSACEEGRHIFVEALDAEDEIDVLRFAIEVLSHGEGGLNNELLDRFIEYPDLLVRVAARSALASRSIPSLISLLDETLEFDNLRRHALEALADTDDPVALELFRERARKALEGLS